MQSGRQDVMFHQLAYYFADGVLSSYSGPSGKERGDVVRPRGI
jgi:hypothetical protein